MNSSATATGPVPAGLVRRLMAMLYDSLLLLALVMFYTALFIGFKVKVLGMASADGEPAATGLAYQLGIPFVWLIFYVYFWRKSGQTLGMQAWRLQLVSADGGRPSPEQCVRRLLAGCLSVAALGLGYWASLWDGEHRTWHDRLSDTRVQLLPKKT